MQRHVLQKWTEAKSRLPLFPIVGTVRCWRSLHGPRHRPSGTGLSSAIMAAPLVAAPSTRAPGHLAPQHCAVCAKSVQDFREPRDHSSCSGHDVTHSAHSPPCAECAEQVFSCNRSDLASPGIPQVMTSCASLSMVARQPPVVMQDAPVGRGGDEPDGGRDRHDGPATPCAGLLTGRALRAREHRLSFCVQATVATRTTSTNEPQPFVTTDTDELLSILQLKPDTFHHFWRGRYSAGR